MRHFRWRLTATDPPAQAAEQLRAESHPSHAHGEEPGSVSGLNPSVEEANKTSDKRFGRDEEAMPPGPVLGKRRMLPPRVIFRSRRNTMAKLFLNRLGDAHFAPGWLKAAYITRGSSSKYGSHLKSHSGCMRNREAGDELRGHAPPTDEREETLPNVGLVQARDAETNKLVWINTSLSSTRKKYQRHYQDRVKYFNKTFSVSGAGRISTKVEESYVKKLLSYFKAR